MRRSPLRHPLAILRTMIGLTQKELGAMVGRAARTIQAVELGQLPLSEELALAVAAETGVDEAWLINGDAGIPPQRGKALLAFSRKARPYRREDFEWQRAFNESPTAPEAELAEVIRKGARPGEDLILTRAQAKAAIKAGQPVILESMDEKLLAAMKAFLEQTRRANDALLVRWKLRRALETLATERKIELPMRDLWEPQMERKSGGRKKRKSKRN